MDQKLEKEATKLKLKELNGMDTTEELCSITEKILKHHQDIAAELEEEYEDSAKKIEEKWEEYTDGEQRLSEIPYTRAKQLTELLLYMIKCTPKELMRPGNINLFLDTEAEIAKQLAGDMKVKDIVIDGGPMNPPEDTSTESFLIIILHIKEVLEALKKALAEDDKETVGTILMFYFLNDIQLLSPFVEQ